MKRRLKMLIVLILMLFVLTGCTNTEYNVKVKRNGSGKVEYNVQFDEDILNSKNVDLEMLELYEVLSGIIKTAEENRI